MALIIGIDPGICGAAAALQCADEEGPEFIADAIDLPTMPDGSKRQIDERAFRSWLRRLRSPARFIIENVRAMPSFSKGAKARRSMGAASAFHFGKAAGQIRATIRLCFDVEPEFVEPRIWKEWFALEGGDKEGARQLALKMWPLSAYLLERKKDHQRAEAMLVAKWGARPAIGRNAPRALVGGLF